MQWHERRSLWQTHSLGVLGCSPLYITPDWIGSYNTRHMFARPQLKEPWHLVGSISHRPSSHPIKCLGCQNSQRVGDLPCKSSMWPTHQAVVFIRCNVFCGYPNCYWFQWKCLTVSLDCSGPWSQFPFWYPACSGIQLQRSDTAIVSPIILMFSNMFVD
jgi:hypothetical protein